MKGGLLVLVDGEHHPSAVRAALAALREGGHEIAGAVFCGGTEKVDLTKLDDAYGVPVSRGEDLTAVLGSSIERFRPEAVLDLTDDPVLTGDDRFRLAGVALARGVPYRGGDFDLTPPVFERVLTKPSVRVFASGKRTGKTAVASALARRAAARGRSPIIVAVGRGGPDPPRIIEAGKRFDPKELIELADAGFHAGSDYVEDAITSGVATIGCVRVGGGLAGGMVWSNVPIAARIAEERDEDFVILEGSGASLPNVQATSGLMCVPAGMTGELRRYLGPYRLLLADLAVVTMAEQAPAAAETEAAIRGIVPDLDVVHVVFRPEPLAPVTGRRVFLCCTAADSAEPVLREHLEQTHGCEVVGMSNRLADRAQLVRDLEGAPPYDVLLTELKAGAVEVAARHAVTRGNDVVFVSNEPRGEGLDAAFDRLVDAAVNRTSE